MYCVYATPSIGVRSQGTRQTRRSVVRSRRLVNKEARQSVRLDQVITPSATPAAGAPINHGLRRLGAGFVVANRSRHHDAVCTRRRGLWRARVVIHCWRRASIAPGRNDERDEAGERSLEQACGFVAEAPRARAPRQPMDGRWAPPSPDLSCSYYAEQPTATHPQHPGHRGPLDNVAPPSHRPRPIRRCRATLRHRLVCLAASRRRRACRMQTTCPTRQCPPCQTRAMA